MLDSIVTGCDWLTTFRGSMLDAGAQIDFVSALTVMNLAILARSVRQWAPVKTSKTMVPVNPLEVWQAVNVSILLWLLCLIVIRTVTQ